MRCSYRYKHTLQQCANHATDQRHYTDHNERPRLHSRHDRAKHRRPTGYYLPDVGSVSDRFYTVLRSILGPTKRRVERLQLPRWRVLHHAKWLQPMSVGKLLRLSF